MEFNLSGQFFGEQLDEDAHQNEVQKVIVIGGGPAGLSAALYAARASLEPLVFTGHELGGQAASTSTIENYPGFPDGVGGKEVSELFHKQAERFGAKFLYEMVTAVDLSQRPFKVSTESGEFQAEALILATGASPNHLGVPGEERLMNNGVSYCATCDGWFFQDKHVVVVGGGDSALEEGILLTHYARKVDIIHRRDELRAGAILQERANSNAKINFVFSSVLEEIIGEDKVESVRLRDKKTGEKTIHAIDGVFIFIGHTPNTQLYEGQVEMDSKGYVVVDKLMQTSVSGVFAAGEAADPHFRQVATSVGMGAGAAIQATRFLEEN
jgi:thioredoxin reductase (NADPH)